MKAITVLFLIFFSLSVSGQNLIGLKEKEIRQYMKDKEKNMNFQSFIYNSTFKYLKYANQEETQTLLFFLTTDSVCKSVRLVCDKSLEAAKRKEMDTMYKKTGENTWIETRGDLKYSFELKEEEWSFNVTITRND